MELMIGANINKYKEGDTTYDSKDNRDLSIYCGMLRKYTAGNVKKDKVTGAPDEKATDIAIENTIQCLGIISGIADHAIKMLKSDKRDYYYKEIW